MQRHILIALTYALQTLIFGSKAFSPHEITTRLFPPYHISNMLSVQTNTYDGVIAASLQKSATGVYMSHSERDKNTEKSDPN